MRSLAALVCFGVGPFWTRGHGVGSNCSMSSSVNSNEPELNDPVLRVSFAAGTWAGGRCIAVASVLISRAI